MTREKLIRVSPRSKRSIWLHKEKHGFSTMAEALDDYIKKMKENERKGR